jgi:protein phosphatase PTC6
VTAEPEVSSKILDGAYPRFGIHSKLIKISGDDHAYLILVTDGLTSLMSDQEIIDLARDASDPTRAAKAIVHFGEDLGAEDNCTCIVVPLAGWGKVGGKDTTEARREYRKRQAGMVNTRMQRM